MLIDLKEIITREPFDEIFPVANETLNRVIENMRENGFDPQEPIVVWKAPSFKRVCIDGYTRLMAADNLGIHDIPVVDKLFDDEDSAIRYAIHRQRDRRNLTDADMIRCIEAVHKRKKVGGDHTSSTFKKAIGPSDPIAFESKSSAEITANIVGTSPNKVKKVLTILNHGDDEIKAAVKSGEKSINRAYTETQQKRKEKEVIQKEQPENQNDNKFWKGILKSIKFLNRKISKGGKYPAKIKSAIKSEILFEFNTLNILITRLENEKKN